MKKAKKFAATLLALVMAFGLSTTAFAATDVSHTQDTSVLNLTSSGNTVTYTAVTVEGDPDGTGTGYEDISTYSYYIMLPSTSATSALSSVVVTARYPAGYTLKVDDVQQPFSGITGGMKISNLSLNMASGAKTFEVYSGSTLLRSFVVSAGISSQDLAPVTMRINVQNAYTWLGEGNSLDAPSAAGLQYITDQTGITATGNTASDIEPITLTGLPAGSTAMDALYYICYGVHDGSGVEVRRADETPITSTGLGIDLDGTGSDGDGHYTYISAMGNADTNAWLGEFSTESLSGWLYLDRQSDKTYNMPMYGASQYVLTGGEDIVWLFTNTYGDFDILW